MPLQVLQIFESLPFHLHQLLENKESEIGCHFLGMKRNFE
uniref:Uncharacterized protein n=1 Tax=Rhizophora mucronata TaxID=61149 RepID=A0A2P2R0G9_RHIMU